MVLGRACPFSWSQAQWREEVNNVHRATLTRSPGKRKAATANPYAAAPDPSSSPTATSPAASNRPRRTPGASEDRLDRYDWESHRHDPRDEKGKGAT